MSEMEELVAAIEDEFCASDRHCKVPEKVVRAVLLKLREPSDERVEAGADAWTPGIAGAGIRTSWKAMIDHILGEQR